MRASRHIITLILCVAFLSCRPATQTQTLTNGKPSPSPLPKGELSIEAGLIYKSGDVKPVARTEFYLLDEDAEKILKDANIERKGALKKPQFDFLTAYAMSKTCVNMLDDCRFLNDSIDFLEQAEKVLKPHILQTITTGFDGKSKFEPTAIGTYYVMGIKLEEKGFVSWNIKVEIKPETQTVILDNNNTHMIV